LKGFSWKRNQNKPELVSFGELPPKKHHFASDWKINKNKTKKRTTQLRFQKNGYVTVQLIVCLIIKILSVCL
jgi:hypothetical protein